MRKKEIIIESATGLHARPAANLVKLTTGLKSKIKLIVNNKEYDGKSILSIMSAGIKNRMKVEIICDGEDEDKAINDLENFFKNEVKD